MGQLSEIYVQDFKIQDFFLFVWVFMLLGKVTIDEKPGETQGP